MEKKRRVGVYLSASVVLNNPDYVEVLRDEIGLNLAVLGFAGQASEALRGKSPFDGVPLSEECLLGLLARDLDGDPLDPREYDTVRAGVGPSVGAGGDDQTLNRAIEVLRRAGVEIWMGLGSWSGSSLMYCPSKDRVNDWYEALYVHCATQYDVDGLDISHARFPKCAEWRGVQACTCADCARSAADMGYDMEEMTAGLRHAVGRWSTAEPGLLAAVGRSSLGAFDLLQWLGMRSEVSDWLRFRAALLGIKMAGFHRAVHAAAGADFVFGSDTHPASLAPFVGNDHSAWADFSDYASPLVSHIESFITHTFTTWVPLLQRVNPGMSEEDVLQMLYRFLGYDGMGMPETLADYRAEQAERLAYTLPLEELILRDLRKARLLLPPHLPSYPIIHGTGWPRAAIDAILQGSDAAGHDGVVWQGTDELVNYRLK